MSKVIGLCGGKGSGKDTVAAMLEHGAKMRGQVLKIIALAAPLKHFVKHVFGFDEVVLFGASHLRDQKTPNTRRECAEAFYGSYQIWCESIGAPTAMETLREWFEKNAIEPMEHGNWPSARTLLQTLGTDWGRTVSQNLWVDYAEKKIEADSPHVTYVITDVRFFNEAEVFGKKDGKQVWRIWRETGHKDSHASEADIYTDRMGGLVDYEIFNNRGFEDLRRAINGRMNWD